jgi:hypothetical protein
MSDLLLIAVPQGRLKPVPVGQTAKAVLSVVITPRLSTDLAAAGMADWPTVVGNARLRVRTRPAGSTTPDTAEPTVTVLSTARTDVWEQFTEGLTVTPFTRPRGYHAPAVTATSRDADDVTVAYTRAVAAMGDPQTVEAVLEGWQDVAPPPTQAVPDQPVQRSGPPDLHLAVARLREHPHMLRLLGLIVDLELEGLPESNADREVSVAWDDSPVPAVSRWTRYDFDGEVFLPAAQGDVVGGLVDLTVPGRWRIVTFDVDGGVATLRQAAGMLAGDRSRQAEGAPSTGGRPSLPPLRSAGMMLTRVGRGGRLAERAQHGLAAAAGGEDETVLMAEDLLLGYRIDVRPQDGDTWYSLHRRRATYEMGAVKEILVEDEEGHVKPHAAVIDDAGLRTDEVVARWDGWSLSVPRPRLDGRTSGNRVAESEQRPTYDFRVTYETVKNSLLELEFGRAYQLRARVADIAGGGLLHDDPFADGAMPLETYTRYEPVPPPRVVAPEGLLVPDSAHTGGFRVDQAVVGPGGSLERLVIRSESAGDDEFSTAAFVGDPTYPDNHSRRVEAPGTSFTIAEHHGFLRLADSTGIANASRAFVGGRAGEPRVDLGTTPQLPDPASSGMAAAVLVQHGLLEQERHDDRPWEGEWPQRVGKTVELVPGRRGSTPRVRWVTVEDLESPDGAASPRVQVVLPPGCQVDVELSSTVIGDRIDDFALNRFLVNGLPEGTPPLPAGRALPPNPPTNEAQNAMVRGRHPLLNPPRRLMLTHAVRQPLAQARGPAAVERFPGETVALVSPAAHPTWGIHVPSTGAVDVVARWDEWGDGPKPTASTAMVTQLSLLRGSTTLPVVRHDFGDTRHRMVTFRLTAISRFRDCFAEGDDATLFRIDGDLDPVSVRSTARPRPPVVLSVVPAFAWQEERAGDTVTRTRLGGRLRVELARPWFTTGQGESLAVVVWPREEAALLEDPTLRSGDVERVTWTNRDPIHATPAPAALPAESAFAGFTGAHEVPLSEGGPLVRALAYPVFFDEGHWFADVELPGVAAASYSPFVRLAVARFQSESLVGPGIDLRMSTVVTAQLAQVLPDRRLVVTRVGSGLEISLTGLARVATTQANRVFASVERLEPSGAPDDVELTSLGLGDPGFPAWRRVAGGTVSGTVNTPLPVVSVPSGPGRFRVVVREVEELRANTSDIGVDAPTELNDRTVFVDIVDLTDP